MSKTGEGVSKGREPTELQFKTESFVGKLYTEGISGRGGSRGGCGGCTPPPAIFNNALDE